MSVIKLSNYDAKMGKLIDVRHPLEYAKHHDKRSINIYADKLIMNPSKYLNKHDTYYIMCEKGVLSKKVIRTLTYYGYNLVQVV
jgi:rhodanese-related sulfurtransferase